MIWCRRDLLSLAALLVCMPADQEDERVGHLNFCVFTVRISRTGCLGDEVVPAAPTLGGGAFGMHASG